MRPATSFGPDRRLLSVFAALAVGLVGMRFYLFRPFLDDPHAFRQAWTSYYAIDLYQSGLNIFRPSIISMGNHRHILIEFPFPEWITALLYHVTGPTLLVDRVVSIAFFLGSAYYLFRLVALIQDRLLAWTVVLVYMAVPLGIYFSRAVHIDVAALCCGHALLFYFLRYGETGRKRDLVGAFVASALGFLIKAPYVFFLILPALYAQLSRRQWRVAAMSAAAFGAALAVGLAWYGYAQTVNRRAPDLSVVKGFEPTADRVDFYVGTADRRFASDDWRTIRTRLRREIAGEVWWMLLPLGLVWGGSLRSFAAVWTLGTVGSLLLFFAANVLHNYYQLTFAAPFAIWLAIPLYRGLRAEGRFASVLRPLALVLLVGYVGTGVRFVIRNYYQVDREGMLVGEFVRGQTTDSDLVIMAYNDAYYLDPRYLYYAQRRGWSVRGVWLEPQAIEGLRAHGATVVVTSDRWPAPQPTARYLEAFPIIDTLLLGNDQVFLRRFN